MNNKTKTRSLRVAIIAIALLLCFALAVGVTSALYQAKRQAKGTLSMDQGIIIDYKGFDKTGDEWSKWERTATLPLFSITNAQPGEQIAVNAAGIRANEKSVNFYARVKLSYKFYNGETPVEFLESTKLIKTSSSFFGTNWVESGDGYFYYAADTTLNKFNKGTQTFVDLFATDAKFIIEGAGFTGATSEGEGGGFVVGDTSINKIEVYLTLETLQGDADAAAEGWKITEVIKPVEVDVTTEEKPDINIDDIISDDKKDGEITISGNPTAMKTILIGSRAFEGCTNLRLKLNNSSNITYIIASDAFSAGAKIWYGAAEATNLLINADTTGKTAGKENAWVVAEPNLKLFLPTGVTQNSTNTSYGKYQYTDDQGTWYFDLIDSNGNAVTLSSTNNMSVSTLSASTYANSNTYTATLNKFEPKDGVTTVIIPKFIGISQDSDKYAVTELSYTFADCGGLTSITIPSSVTSISSSAFSDCKGLTSITIPDSVTSIGNNAFAYCSGLTSINVDSKNPKYHSAGNCLIETASKTLIAGCDNSVIPNDGSVTSIGNGAFSGRRGLTSITIPNSVKSIGTAAFAGCSGLTTITIPDKVTSIEGSAFDYCTNLTEITIPSSVTSIGGNAFSSCGLTSIKIPDSVTSIGGGAFSNCSGLTSMHIGAGIKEVSWLPENVSDINIAISENNQSLATDSKAIFVKSKGELSVSKYISARETYDIPAAVNNFPVTSIGSYAFFDYSSLKSITIPSSVTSIGYSAFNCCSGLQSVIIGQNVTSIENYAFANCSGLTSVVIKGNITEIPDYCFSDCSKLTSIVLPSSVTTIEDGAFSGCSKLTTIYVDSADATAITGLGFTKVDDTLYDENGIANTSGKYYKYSGAIA